MSAPLWILAVGGPLLLAVLCVAIGGEDIANWAHNRWDRLTTRRGKETDRG